jgi:hypothetical protein
MVFVGLVRVLASLCALLSLLCAAASAPILFGWAIDSARPVSVVPLLVSASLLLVARALFLAYRALLGRLAMGNGSFHWLPGSIR